MRSRASDLFKEMMQGCGIVGFAEVNKMLRVETQRDLLWLKPGESLYWNEANPLNRHFCVIHHFPKKSHRCFHIKASIRLSSAVTLLL